MKEGIWMRRPAETDDSPPFHMCPKPNPMWMCDFIMFFRYYIFFSFRCSSSFRFDVDASRTCASVRECREPRERRVRDVCVTNIGHKRHDAFRIRVMCTWMVLFLLRLVFVRAEMDTKYNNDVGKNVEFLYYIFSSIHLCVCNGCLRGREVFR